MLPSTNTFIFSKIERSYFFCTFIKNIGLMKTNHLGILFILLLSIGSCKKKESPIIKAPTTVSNNVFKLKKDGVPYSANYINVSSFDPDFVTVQTQTVYLDTYNNTYGVTIWKSISPGTYLLEDGVSNYFTIIHSQDQNTGFGWEHGTLTVLSNDTIQKVMQCNFEVKLFNDEINQYPEITDGEMTIYY